MNKKITLVANVIMGDRDEIFFPHCLEAIKDGVDLLILNDNSSNRENVNLQYVRDSHLYKKGRVDLLFSEFHKEKGFAGARNICLDRVQELVDRKELPLENLWILYLDCDEVHPPSFTNFVHDRLNRVPWQIGMVDGYMYQFILTFRYYTTLERRHNLFFRFYKEIRWQRPVHETLINLQGKRMATGYTYCHYGYLLPKKDLLERWRLYNQFGGLDFELSKVKEDSLFIDKIQDCIPYSKKHPPSMEPFISDFEENLPEINKKFLESVETYRKNPLNRLKSSLRDFNYNLRLLFREMESK